MDENTTTTPQPVDTGAGGTPKDARNWAMACHLFGLAGLVITGIGFILGPLVIWLIKREEDPFIDDQGKEALNFQITMFIAMVISFFLMFLVIGAFLLPVVVLLDIIFTIIGGIKASDGVKYRYPFAIRFVS